MYVSQRRKNDFIWRRVPTVFPTLQKSQAEIKVNNKKI